MTLAVLRLIIGVVPEQKSCTGAKNKQESEKLHEKQALLAGACFFYHQTAKLLFTTLPRYAKTRPIGRVLTLFGGAAGHCPRVRQVTYRSSTYIVLLGLFSHVIR